MFITFNKKIIIEFLKVLSIFFLLSLIVIYIINLITLSSNKTIENNKTNQNIIQNNTINIFNNSTIEVSSLPISNKTIILDAGHGLPDGGAVSNSNSDIFESTLNLNIVLKLQKLLELSNINVILTRSDENGIYKETETSIRKKKLVI